MRKIRVLEMIDKPFLGGGQVHLLSLAANLDKDRFDVRICAGGDGPLEREAGRRGLAFLSVTLEKKLSRQAVEEISALLRQNEIDILHTHGGVAGFAGRRAAADAGTPIVVHTLHGIHYLNYRNPILRRLGIHLERRCSRLTDAVIFVSEADFRRGLKHRLAPGDKMRLIRNGVDVSDLTDGDTRARKIDEIGAKLRLSPPVVGTVARLHRQKGVPFLLRAAGDVHRRCPAAKFVVVGGGPLEASLRERVARMDIGRTFLFLGERGDAREIMSLFDVFVLPSLWEGLPLVLIEAAALGKPIVATDIDGVREVIRDGETGILVPPGRPHDLGQAIIRLLCNPAEAAALGERAKKEIPPRFALADMVAAIRSLYIELFEKKTSRIAAGIK